MNNIIDDIRKEYYEKNLSLDYSKQQLINNIDFINLNNSSIEESHINKICDSLIFGRKNIKNNLIVDDLDFNLFTYIRPGISELTSLYIYNNYFKPIMDYTNENRFDIKLKRDRVYYLDLRNLREDLFYISALKTYGKEILNKVIYFNGEKIYIENNQAFLYIDKNTIIKIMNIFCSEYYSTGDNV